MRYFSKAAGFFFTTAFVSFNPLLSQAQQPVASFYYDERGSVVRQDQDTNGDGRMDRSIYYDRDGQTERVEPI
jgi:hypothetical protein